MGSPLFSQRDLTTHCPDDDDNDGLRLPRHLRRLHDD